MEFGTWYHLPCESEDVWPDDFALIRDTGFDFVVLWNFLPPRGEWGGDSRKIVHVPDKTLRALDEAAKAGLVAYVGIWHPYHMGKVPMAHRPRWSDGKLALGPNIFNTEWLQDEWLPYVRSAAERFAGHDAYGGIYLDDTFPALPTRTNGCLSYSASDRARFREWLKARYLSVQNLNVRHKLTRLKGRRGRYRSFRAIDPPARPEDALVLWTDWMRARADWCEDFARQTMEAYRSIDPNPRHEVVLSDQDYHLECNALQYGVDYHRLMRHFDRFELYMAVDHRLVSRRELLASAETDVLQGMGIAREKPFQFHTWFADPVEFRPMKPASLEGVLQCAADHGADAIEVFCFKIHDWQRPLTKRQWETGLPPLKEVSLKYNRPILRCLRRVFSRLK